VLHEQFQRLGIPSFEEWFVTCSPLMPRHVSGLLPWTKSGKLDAFAARAVYSRYPGFTRMYAPSTVSIAPPVMVKLWRFSQALV